MERKYLLVFIQNVAVPYSVTVVKVLQAKNKKNSFMEKACGSLIHPLLKE